jgi:hypothetical protein
MWAKINNFLAHIFRQPTMDWQEERYLNSAQNVSDLEHRQRQLSQQQRGYK